MNGYPLSAKVRTYINVWIPAFYVLLNWSPSKTRAWAKKVNGSFLQEPALSYVAQELVALLCPAIRDSQKLKRKLYAALVGCDEFCDVKADWDLFESRRRVEPVLEDHGGRLPPMPTAKHHKVTGALSTLSSVLGSSYNSQDAFVAAAEEGAISAMQQYLSEGARIDDSGDTNWTPLIAAARKHRTESLKWLIKHNADLDSRTRDKRGITALMIAAERGFTEVVNLLLRSGADVNARDSQGRTALVFALQGCRVDAIRLLLKHGARIPASRILLQTLLGPPTIRCRIDILRALGKAGARFAGCGNIFKKMDALRQQIEAGQSQDKTSLKDLINEGRRL